LDRSSSYERTRDKSLCCHSASRLRCHWSPKTQMELNKHRDNRTLSKSNYRCGRRGSVHRPVYWTSGCRFDITRSIGRLLRPRGRLPRSRRLSHSASRSIIPFASQNLQRIDSAYLLLFFAFVTKTFVSSVLAKISTVEWIC
jgi:hypothetical protein